MNFSKCICPWASKNLSTPLTTLPPLNLFKPDLKLQWTILSFDAALHACE